MELSGGWVAAAADDGLRRVYPEPDFDDRTWEPVAVPGHWRSEPAFTRHDGPVLYRHRFEGPAPEDGRRVWVTFDGIFYQSDVWLDGAYLGDTEGYFFPHAFEVTEQLRSRNGHVLAVEVTCARPTDRTAKRNLTGVFQHWDCLDPDWNPGGIWRPVHLSETGPVRIGRARVLCTEATEEAASFEIRAVLHVENPTPATLEISLANAAGTVVAATDAEQTLAAGENRIRTVLRVERPDLWWPHALGDQPLHNMSIGVRVPGHDRPSDTITRQTGIRRIRMKNWIMTVNGERLFLKGSNQGPTRMALAEASAGELERDVVLAKDTGLDLLRVHAHITRPELYDAADRHGVLLWQDLPLQWGYARGVRKQATRQAREAVDLLGHHPSIALWCGHNEPLALDIEPGRADASPARTALRFAALQELPTWNKTVLDGSVKRTLEKADPTRPVVAHSGVLPSLGSGGTDSHFYFGWYHGDERSFPALCGAFPRLARFVTEFGAQAVPESADFMDAERWPDLDWEGLGRAHALQRTAFDRYVPPADYDTFDAWRKATQTYQSTVIRFHIETLRALKYRPTGGFCQFSFADAHPSVTWSVLDHRRIAKDGWRALAAACASVIIVATRPHAVYRPGEQLALDVHAVSDLRVPVPEMIATAVLRWPGGSQEWRWAGDLPADTCRKVGTVRLEVPDAPGLLTLELDLTGDGAAATNHYQASIRP